MATVTRCVRALLSLTLILQDTAASPGPAPQNMWVSMQVGVGTGDGVGQDQSVGPQAPSYSNPTTALFEVPDSYVSYQMPKIYVILLQLAPNYSSSKVPDLETCYGLAEMGEYGSMTFSEGDCTVSSYWRTADFLTNSDNLKRVADETTQAVYFRVRNDGSSCYAPNMKLLNDAETVLVDYTILEELKLQVLQATKVASCERKMYRCNNGNLEEIQETSYPYVYSDVLDMCIHGTKDVLLENYDDLRSTCISNGGIIFNVQNREEEQRFNNYSDQVKWAVPLDIQYDQEDQKYKWAGTDMEFQGKWDSNKPTEDKNPCTLINKDGVQDHLCSITVYLFCRQVPLNIEN